MNDVLFWLVWAAAGFIMLVFYIKRKKKIGSVLFGMVTGVIALAVLHYFGSGLGYQPELNLFNCGVALVLGVPGVIMMLVMNKFM